MYLVDEEDEGEETTAPNEEMLGESSASILPEISLHALAGKQRSLRGHKVSVLVDTGSTHNFIAKKSAKALGCTIEQQPTFNVGVGDESSVKCSGRWSLETLEIQGHKFPVELFTVAMAGAELILGIQWLRGLAEVVWDFVGMQMHFDQNGGSRQTLTAAAKKPNEEQPAAKILKGLSSPSARLGRRAGPPPGTWPGRARVRVGKTGSRAGPEPDGAARPVKSSNPHPPPPPPVPHPSHPFHPPPPTRRPPPPPQTFILLLLSPILLTLFPRTNLLLPFFFATIGSLFFPTPNGSSYQVTSIAPQQQRFVIRPTKGFGSTGASPST
ncbi:hypothetical protein EJ110_NYTH31979 [Nymphaea thermarum]|nr:hypothetical protein EJ110_NYTH31979 [Nymphaea thermarum]